MYKNRRILALIPARGGSRRLEKKNVKLLAGKPLVAWTIEQGIASRYLDAVVVSTDDEEIAAVSRFYGAEVPHLRPASLARDDSPTIDAVLLALQWLERRGDFFDYVALLEPTSPLRKETDIDEALMRLIDAEESADAVISLGEIQLENPYIAKVLDGRYLKPFVEDGGSRSRPGIYFPYGVVYAAKTTALRTAGTFYQARSIPYFIERWQNYEVDDLCDFLCVEAIMKSFAKKEPVR